MNTNRLNVIGTISVKLINTLYTAERARILPTRYRRTTRTNTIKRSRS